MTRIYVHAEGQHEPESVEAAADTTIADVVGTHDGALVVLLEDSDEALGLELSLDQAGIADRAHIFAGRRSRILAEVNFNGESREREFSASTRVQRVFKWATGNQGFDLSKADAAEHTLALCSTGEIPAGDVHLGALDNETHGRVCFNLIPKHRFEG